MGFGRLIPARAGNTLEAYHFIAGEAAHPRSRGEHELMGTSVRGQNGSSPLARGTRHHPHGPDALGRLIPARAGNTPGSAAARSRFSAHPRSRGEHFGASYDYWRESGSSPLARGTHQLYCMGFALHRLIPARAGNTVPPVKML